MLVLITNRKMVKEDTFSETIEKAVAGGVDAVILREKDLGYDELYEIAKDIKKRIKDKDTYLIINSNLEVAKAVNADGYHIGFHDFMKEKHNWNNIIGVSVHSVEEAILAEKNGASYLIASHVFETDCKKGLAPRGLDFIKEIKSNVNIKVIALGGIKLENVEKVVSTGVEGVAVMSSIMAAEDPYRIASQFKNKMSHC